MLRKLLAAFGLALFISTAAHAQSAGQMDYRQLGASLPPVRIVTDSGKIFTEADAVPGENLFIMLFNPTCDHCQDAARLFGKHDSLFKPGQLYLMAAAAMLPHLNFFENTTHYKKHPVIRVGVDSSGFIERTFNYQGLPELLIYDRNRHLMRTMSGTLSMDSLMPYLGPAARQYTGPLLTAPAVAPASGSSGVGVPADQPRKARKKRNR